MTEKLKQKRLVEIGHELQDLTGYLSAPGHGKFWPQPDEEYIKRVGRFNPRWEESIRRFWKLMEEEEELKKEIKNESEKDI